MTQGSLFDGAGGMRRGLEQAGFKTKWTLDKLMGQDVTMEDPNNYEAVDLISGGPPCQRGSNLAALLKNRTKITLWPSMLQFVKVLRPKWVLVENVIGFLPEMVTEWTPQLQQLGYGCAGQCISSRHWVPQIRTRAFIIGRLETEGLALWHMLYADGIRGKVGTQRYTNGKQSQQQYRPDSNCLRNGIPTRVPEWDFACLGAGNAVTVPVARFLGERIRVVEKAISGGKFENRSPQPLWLP